MTKSLRISYPNSFLQLLIVGFTLAMLPLLFAFGSASHQLDRLADQSRDVINQAVQATRTSRIMVEQLTLMERSVRQFFVLHDNLLLDNYARAHQAFKQSIIELSHLQLGQEQQYALQKLSAQESELHELMQAQTPKSKPSKALLDQFSQLSNQTQNILAENNRLIDQRSALLVNNAESTQKIILWQTITLLPVGLLIAVVLALLIARPIRRMDAAIHRLGRGEYVQPIFIGGPGDLRSLGERLDWLRSQLLLLDEQKKQFLRHVSHELKTPLTAIREGSELLKDEIGGILTPQQREIADILQDNSLRLQKMIENMLDYTAVQYQKPELKIEYVELMGLVDEVLAQYALTLSNKRIKIDRKLQATIVSGDLAKLRTIIDNLLSNAIKYTPHSGTIRIDVRAIDASAIFEVHDGGPGINEADSHRIFDPFYKGNDAYESLVSGSGLGLSISKEYVEAHGGEITLLPAPQGAHFHVRLPLKAVKI